MVLMTHRPSGRHSDKTGRKGNVYLPAFIQTFHKSRHAKDASTVFHRGETEKHIIT